MATCTVWVMVRTQDRPVIRVLLSLAARLGIISPDMALRLYGRAVLSRARWRIGDGEWRRFD